MEIDSNVLKRLLKEAVLEALYEYDQQKREGNKKQQEPQPKVNAPTYEEVFHRVMGQVAKKEIDEATAGQLIAEARIAFSKQGTASNTAETPPPNMPSFLLDKLMAWEQEIQGYSGRAAESTLEMMERMREKLEKEAQEAEFYKASQQLDKEVAQQKAASDLQAIKDRLSKEK